MTTPVLGIVIDRPQVEVMQPEDIAGLDGEQVGARIRRIFGSFTDLLSS
jgi:hypothetical protein